MFGCLRAGRAVEHGGRLIRLYVRDMPSELLSHYNERVVASLKGKHNYANVHQVPRVTKVVVNTCIGSQADGKQALEDAKAELTLITGQKPSETRSKKSIANFKLRQNQAIGAKVTLRGERMYEFLERLIKMALPRIRDFRGVSSRAFDGNGNYTLGVSDQSIFPEVELDILRWLRARELLLALVRSLEKPLHDVDYDAHTVKYHLD
jgi:large subunit ribosomal protein L5